MRRSFVRTTIDVRRQNAPPRPYPFNPPRNDPLRPAIPMQIFTRLNAVRLLILRRHFGSLWEDRRQKDRALVSTGRPGGAKDRCPIYTYVTAAARKLNYVRKARTDGRTDKCHFTAVIRRQRLDWLTDRASCCCPDRYTEDTDWHWLFIDAATALSTAIAAFIRAYSITHVIPHCMRVE